MNHRGRFQAQGPGLESSEPWSEIAPLAALMAHHLLSALQANIPPREATLRMDGFHKAHRFIDGCAKNGGVGATKQSWPKPSRKDSRRVDIEVQKGIAFI